MSRSLLNMMSRKAGSPGSDAFSNLIAYYDCGTSGNLLDSVGALDLIPSATIDLETTIAISGNSRGPGSSTKRFELTGSAFAWGVSKWVGGWFYPTDVSDIAIARCGSGSDRIYYAKINSSAQLELRISSDGSNYDYTVVGSSDTITINSWNFLAFGWDSSSAEIWVSVNAGTIDVAASVAPYVGAGAFHLFRDQGAGDYFKGYVDELGYYSGVPTDAQLDWLYNAGAGNFYTP